jgi:hypothetical protein
VTTYDYRNLTPPAEQTAQRIQDNPDVVHDLDDETLFGLIGWSAGYQQKVYEACFEELQRRGDLRVLGTVNTTVTVDLAEVAIALRVRDDEGTVHAFQLDVPTAHRLGASLTEAAERLATYAAWGSHGKPEDEYRLPDDPGPDASRGNVMHLVPPLEQSEPGR